MKLLDQYFRMIAGDTITVTGDDASGAREEIYRYAHTGAATNLRIRLDLEADAEKERGTNA